MGVGVNATIMSETLSVINLGESDTRPFRLRKKPMNVCACDNETREDGDEREDVVMGAPSTFLVIRFGIFITAE